VSLFRRTDRRFLFATAGLILAATGLSACSSSGSAFAPFAILLANTRVRTVQLTLDASATDANGGFNFDGYSNGALSVSVPVGWTVQVSCNNDSATLSHSCAIVDDRPIFALSPPIAFPGASIPDPSGGGLPLGGSESFTFVASRVGRYRMTCLVPGHEVAGMWDWFVVTAGGRPWVTT